MSIGGGVKCSVQDQSLLSTPTPLLLSCPPQKSEATHLKLHGTSLEQVCERKSRPDHLVPVDGSKVSAIEGITMPAEDKIL